MSLFQKKMPKVCPKCGEEKGWVCVPNDASHQEMDNYQLSSASAPNQMYGTFGSGLSRRPAKKKITVRYRCSKCGYEKEI